LQAYQWARAGVAKLPPFQIAASTPPATQHPPAPSRLDPADVSLLSVYARVYCAYLDRPARRLLLYRFYKCGMLCCPSFDSLHARFCIVVMEARALLHAVLADAVEKCVLHWCAAGQCMAAITGSCMLTIHGACARRDAVMLQHRFEMAAKGPVAFAVADSLLLAHHADSGAIHIFDVVAHASRAVAPAQPLTLVQPGVRLLISRLSFLWHMPPERGCTAGCQGSQTCSRMAVMQAPEEGAELPASSSSSCTSPRAPSPGPQQQRQPRPNARAWRFEAPNLILDAENGVCGLQLHFLNGHSASSCMMMRDHLHVAPVTMLCAGAYRCAGGARWICRRSRAPAGTRPRCCRCCCTGAPPRTLAQTSPALPSPP
jgi:hypothetical protein